MTRSYSLNDVFMFIDSILVTEYAEGDAIEIEFDEDDTTETQGSHGSVMVAERPNNIAGVVFRLMQGSPVNGFMWDLRKRKRGSGVIAFTFMVRDNRGEALVSTAQAWIKKPAGVGMGTEIGNREWALKLGNPQMKDGENVLA